MDPVRIGFLDTLPAHMLIRARPVAPQLLQPLKEQLEQFVEQGYLRRLPIGQYGVGLVVIKKTCGALRICGDYRPINKYIRHMPLTMPDIHVAIQRLIGFKMFGECDWTTAFHQVPLDEITSQRLAISTPCGLFAPNFLPGE